MWYRYEILQYHLWKITLITISTISQIRGNVQSNVKSEVIQRLHNAKFWYAFLRQKKWIYILKLSCQRAVTKHNLYHHWENCRAILYSRARFESKSTAWRTGKSRQVEHSFLLTCRSSCSVCGKIAVSGNKSYLWSVSPQMLPRSVF